MERRAFVLSIGTAFLTGSAATTAASALASRTTKPSREAIRVELTRRTAALAPSRSRDVSLALLAKPESLFYVDENDLPAARWRGVDDLGACVHVRPETEVLYLETQYPASVRADKAPKYIQFAHAGPWHSRRHNALDKFMGTEKNWIDEGSEREGRALLDLLHKALGAEGNVPKVSVLEGEPFRS